MIRLITNQWSEADLLRRMNRIKRANNLIKAIQRGDKKALHTFYVEYGAFFLSIAKYYLYDKTQAEDLLGDVYLELVRNNAKSFNNKFNGLNWMYVIVKKKAYKYNAAVTSNSLEYDDKLCCLSDVLSTKDTLDSVSLKTALTALSEYENKLLYLRYWESLTIREIATKLQKPSSTIHYELNRILKKLKDVLE